MPDYEFRLSINAEDLLDAHELVTEIVLPPGVELLSTNVLGDQDEDIDEEITKTTFTYVVMHRSDEPMDTLEEALQKVDDGDAVGLGAKVSSVGVPHSHLERELIELNDYGDFFNG